MIVNKQSNKSSRQTLDHKKVVATFEKVAASYQSTRHFYARLEAQLLERFAWFRLEPQVIVDLGCGQGQGLSLLEKQFPQAQCVGIDVSQTMLSFAKKACSSTPYITADAMQLPLATQSVDILYSHLLLPWITDYSTFFAECYRVLRPQGLFLFSSVGPDTLQELRVSWQVIGDPFTRVHSFIDMHDLGDALMKQGLIDAVMDRTAYRLSYTQLEDLFQDLKNIGASNFASYRCLGLTTSRALHAMKVAYADRYLENGRYPATCEFVIGHAFATESREEVSIPLDRISGLRRHVIHG